MLNLLRILIAISFLSTISYTNNIDVNKIIIQAKQKNKNLLFFVHHPKCGYCNKMLNESFKNKTILNEIKENFILIDIDISSSDVIIYKDSNMSMEDFAKNEISATNIPATIFSTPNENLLKVIIGYRNIDEFLSEIKYISSGSYKHISFEQFSEELEFNKDD